MIITALVLVYLSIGLRLGKGWAQHFLVEQKKCYPLLDITAGDRGFAVAVGLGTAVIWPLWGLLLHLRDIWFPEEDARSCGWLR